MNWTELLGFVTGALCVWLVVRENAWNWPIGLANNVFFYVLFYQSRLYADMDLQVVFFVLGAYGWINWLRGGKQQTPLRISRTLPLEWIALLIFVLAGVPLLRAWLISINGAAPFWDSATTILSLAAQYLLCQKRLEHWYFWIVADIIYVPLYISRGLHLTAILYAGFLILCIVGLREWLARRAKLAAV